MPNRAEVSQSRSPKKILAGILGVSMALGSAGAVVKPPEQVFAQTEDQSNAINYRVEIFEGNPLDRNNITTEVLLAMSVPGMNDFNSNYGIRRIYESTPPERIDGITPQGTITFINTYLPIDNPLTLADLTWERVITDQSSLDGNYISMSHPKNGKIGKIAEPDSFGAISFFSNGVYVFDYMEFQIPEVPPVSMPTEEQSYELIESVLRIPDVPQYFTSFDIPFTQELNGGGSTVFTERYFALLFLNDANGYAAMILVNSYGNIHIAEAGRNTVGRILERSGKSSQLKPISQTTP